MNRLIILFTDIILIFYYYQEALSKDYGVPTELIEVENFVLKPGSKKGDGFSCQIAAVQFQAKVDGKSIDKSYIAKYGPEGNRGEILTKVTELSLGFSYWVWNSMKVLQGVDRKPLYCVIVLCFLKVYRHSGDRLRGSPTPQKRDQTFLEVNSVRVNLCSHM